MLRRNEGNPFIFCLQFMVSDAYRKVNSAVLKQCRKYYGLFPYIAVTSTAVRFAAI